ncbi:hypothetical protein SZ55_2257 [Pseudomonas sp. FeS53a]|nr:hypothetical protein SZ55_2257 [Pseudomonas sp. FeS53a]
MKPRAHPWARGFFQVHPVAPRGSGFSRDARASPRSRMNSLPPSQSAP